MTEGSKRKSSGSHDGIVSKSKIEELNRIREAILARAREKVDPEGTGFNPLMMATDDGSFFGETEEQQFLDWLDWAERLLSTISLISQRVSTAILTTGLAIAGANMVGAERTTTLGYGALGAAGIFAVWFVGASIAGPKGRGGR